MAEMWLTATRHTRHHHCDLVHQVRTQAAYVIRGPSVWYVVS